MRRHPACNAHHTHAHLSTRRRIKRNVMAQTSDFNVRSGRAGVCILKLPITPFRPVRNGLQWPVMTGHYWRTGLYLAVYECVHTISDYNGCYFVIVSASASFVHRDDRSFCYYFIFIFLSLGFHINYCSGNGCTLK